MSTFTDSELGLTAYIAESRLSEPSGTRGVIWQNIGIERIWFGA